MSVWSLLLRALLSLMLAVNGVAAAVKRHRTAAHNATVKSTWLVGGRSVAAAAWPDRFAVCSRCTLV